MRYLYWLSAALVILGARLWLINNYGSALPILDQWDIEANAVIRPSLHGTLRFWDLFEPHNEHRLVCSKSLSLGLLLLNGQWDSRLEMVVNALLFSAAAVWVGIALSQRLGRANPYLLWFSIMLWGALPYGHENSLWGSQSQFYFLIFLSLLAVWMLECTKLFEVRWWIGACASVLACLSMASGFVAALTVALLLILRVVTRRSSLRAVIPTLAACTIIVLLSWHYRLELPENHALRAASAAAWLTMFGRCLAWPFIDVPLLAPIMYLPFTILLWRKLFHHQKAAHGANDAGNCVIAAGTWVILQAALIAFGRGGDGGGEMPSRYMDILALGPLMNAVAFASLSKPVRSRYPRSYWSLSALAACVVIGAAAYLSYELVARQHGRKAALDGAEETVRAYVLTGNAADFLDSLHMLTHPNRARIRDILDDEKLRDVLPAEVRLPLRIEPAQNDGFRLDGYSPETVNPAYERVWGSYSINGAVGHATMRTTTITPRLSYLRIEVAGHLEKRTTLAAQDELSGSSHELKARYGSNTVWRHGDLPIPSHRIQIVAGDATDTGWLAFREPREMGKWSAYAESLTHQGKKIFAAGLMLAVAVLVAPLFLPVRLLARF